MNKKRILQKTIALVIILSLLLNNAIISLANENKSDTTLKIVSNPQNYIGNVGENATFKVVAEGEGLNYQWQGNGSGTWKNSGSKGYNTNTLLISIIDSRNGYQYRCIIKDSNGNQVVSEPATLLVDNSLEIITQPKDYTGVIGEDAKYSIEAKGKGITYQWQLNSSGTWKNTGLTGNKTNTLTVPIQDNRNGYQYRCVVKDSSGTVINSDAATLSVKSNLTITKQPENYIGAVDDVAEFMVEADGYGLTYQWQLNSSGTWKNTSLTGYKTKKLSVPITVTRNGYQYRCIVKDKYNGEVISDPATLTVKSELKVLSQPQDCSGNVGETAEFVVEAKGVNLKYQWQLNSTGTWKNTGLTGNKTNKLSVPILASRDGYQYRCIVCDGIGNQVITDAATLKVHSIHTWLDGICSSCDLECAHKNLTYIGFNNGVHYAFCRECNTEGEDLPCVDADNDGTCDLCDASMPAACNHSWVDGICSECGVECTHDNLDQNGKCDTCGAVAFK